MDTAPIPPLDELAFDHYAHLGGVREQAAALACELTPRCASILDVGTGNGLFALAQARVHPEAELTAIDSIHEFVGYARDLAHAQGVAQRCRFAVGDFFELSPPPRPFARVSFFLSLGDLLRRHALARVLVQARQLCAADGSVLICEELPELANDAPAQLGYRVQRAVGYRYPTLAELRSVLSVSGFRVEREAAYATGLPALGVAATRRYIETECSYNRRDRSGPRDAEAIWQPLAEAVATAGGVRLYDRIGLVYARAAASR